MKTMGTVYFFTGLPRTGKSTLGRLFYQRLKNTKPNVVYLGENELCAVFDQDIGNTQHECLYRVKRISQWCKLLSDQGIDVVCSSVAMSHSVRQWNRMNIPNYKEIYLWATKETLLTRDQKNFYSIKENMNKINQMFDKPEQPDLIIQNNGDRTPLELVEEVERVFYPNIVDNPIDNKAYWNCYYQNKLCTNQPSPFAHYVSTLVEPGKTLVDLGCGNGRDSVFFAEVGLTVVAIDLSDRAIQMLTKQNIPNIRFLCGDFISNSIHSPECYDYAYSRFTIHAINQQQENLLIQTIYRALKPGGKFFIEVRSIHDPLFGKGKQLERNSFFYDNHYRRFIVLDDLVVSLQSYGFMVEYAKEQTGFAPYGNDDPPVIRIVACKPSSKV